MPTLRALLIALVLFSVIPVPKSQAVSGDLGLLESNVWFSTSQYLEGHAIRIWASIQNNSSSDLLGSVRFTSQEGNIGADQPISALAGKTDEVFVDWVPQSYGEFTLTITVLPWDASQDDSNNNVVKKTIYVQQDTDYDGIPNESDDDKDGDGVANGEDLFPLTQSESKDTDGDGQGNQADPDDDNDGTLDTEDQMPEDARYTKDQDGDGEPDENDEDLDGDGLPNEEEGLGGSQTDPRNADSDADGTPDGLDAFPTDPTESSDQDQDGLGDQTDPDQDGDGMSNEADPAPSDPAPKAAANNDVIWLAGLNEEITFSGSASKDNGSITRYVWNFGGEEQESQESEEGAEVQHRFTSTGLQVATLTVYDESGQSDSTQVTVRVLDYRFLGYALIFALLLILLAFYLIDRYNRRAPRGNRALKAKKKK